MSGSISVGKRFRRWLQQSSLLYALFAATVWFFDVLPWRVARVLGRLGGRLAYAVDLSNVRRARANLELVFPGQTAEWRERVLVACYEHLGRSLTDVCRFRSMTQQELLNDWIVPGPDSHRVMREALAEGRGVLGLSAHAGFWELIGFAFPALGYPLVSIANRISAPRIEYHVKRIRERLGNRIVYQEGALLPLLRSLRDGQTLGIIMDHWAGPEGLLVPFFGRETRTVTSVARIHQKCGTPVVINYMLRRPDGRYDWRAHRVPMPPAAGLSPDEHLRALTLACNKAIEEVILEAPEQWIWMHKRWR
jgi:KDO2-lipid IV(A) lauroyltransferase